MPVQAHVAQAIAMIYDELPKMGAAERARMSLEQLATPIAQAGLDWMLRTIPQARPSAAHPRSTERCALWRGLHGVVGSTVCDVPLGIAVGVNRA
jgi:hypothetical protein